MVNVKEFWLVSHQTKHSDCGICPKPDHQVLHKHFFPKSMSNVIVHSPMVPNLCHTKVQLRHDVSKPTTPIYTKVMIPNKIIYIIITTRLIGKLGWSIGYYAICKWSHTTIS